MVLAASDVVRILVFPLVLLLVGAAVSGLLIPSLTRKRDERRLLNEYRAGIADELLDAYHRVKAVRRTLRALGFRPPVSGSLSAEQAAGFRSQMELLVDAQLALEKVALDVEGQPSVYGRHSQAVRTKVRGAEEYVNQVISDWEDHGATFKAGADVASVVGPLTHVQSFLKGAGLKQNVSTPVIEAARLIHSLRLPGGD